MKVFNKNNEIGVLALFHCLYDENKKADAITGTYSSSNVDGIKGDRFAVSHQTSGKVEVLERNETKDITLEYMKHELFTISPIKDGIAPFGLLDKLNGSHAVNSFIINDGVAKVELKQGGLIGVYCESKPKSVEVDGETQSFKYDKESGLLIVETSKTNLIIKI
jgi:hypothetical protein